MKITSITGRLGADATSEEYAPGKHVMKMNVYVEGRKEEENSIIEIVKYSDKTPNNLTFFKKGLMIEASGTHSCSAYIDKYDKPRVSEKLFPNVLSVISRKEEIEAETEEKKPAGKKTAAKK